MTKLNPAWYVLLTRSRFEGVVDSGLQKKMIEVFLPRVRVPSRRRDRRVTLHRPLFPGYLFVRTDLHPHHHLDILKTTGAVRLIGSNTGPVPVSDDAIESLKIMVSTEQEVVTGSRFKRGDAVLVMNGPFAGVTGIFTRYKGKDRVVVKIEALGQFAGVDVDINDIEPIPAILV